MSLFSTYTIPFNIETEGISLSIEREGEVYVYRRECLEEKVNKLLLSDEKKIVIQPVEPCNTPKELSPYLLVEFERSLVVEPRIQRRVFLKFPVEIGVYISYGKDFELLDVFSKARQKYTLYGDPRSGSICKYWKSEVYESLPSANPLQEGVLELRLENSDSEWIEVSKAVFNSYGMILFFSRELVSMRAKMKIENNLTAETDFLDSPLKKGMIRARKIFTEKKLPIVTPKFVMREGL